jgi:SAM-dependent methyltransferase
VRRAAIETFQPGYLFDTVTCFDVLEHVLDPPGFLRAVQRLLVPGGTVCISVPNQGSLIRKLMGRRWFFYIPEEHLHYFHAGNLRLLLKRTGFGPADHSSAPKVLTYRYSLTQFREFNPLIYAGLRGLARLMPAALLDYPLKLYIGELLMIARREASPAAGP